MPEPVKLGAMDAIAPVFAERVSAALAALPAPGGAPTPAALARVTAMVRDGRAHVGADSSLVAVGEWLADARQVSALRELGCAWLGLFPTVEVVKRLAALVSERATPHGVREAAIAALGDRELRGAHASTVWNADAAQLADEALARLADAATVSGRITSEVLPRALRHVGSDMIAAIYAKAPALWAPAIESFATPPLARVLFVSLEDIASVHRIRVLRLIAATLGEDAVPMLVTRTDVTPVELRERLLLAVALEGEGRLPALEEAVRDQPASDAIRQRARWHVQHRGVIPLIRALRSARTLGTVSAAERAEKARLAADDFAAHATFERLIDREHYALWAHTVRTSGENARALAVVAAHPPAQSMIGDMYLEELARRGRVDAVAIAAHDIGAVDRGALLLAIWGRPLAALELAATARTTTPALVSARALAAYRAGRPDLAQRVLAASASGQTLAAVVALAEPAPFDADPDRPTLAPLAMLEAALAAAEGRA